MQAPGEADLNVYAYVRGHALKSVDPLGLQDIPTQPEGTIPPPPGMPASPKGEVHIGPIQVKTGADAVAEARAAGRHNAQIETELVALAADAWQRNLDKWPGDAKAQQAAFEAEVQQYVDAAEAARAGVPNDPMLRFEYEREYTFARLLGIREVGGPIIAASVPSGGNRGSTAPARGGAHPKTRAAAARGSTLHSDKPGHLPDQLRARFPDTQFKFTKPGQKGQDVEVVGGKHPSEYEGSTWPQGVNHGDFKPGTASGRRTFQSDQKRKWKQRTQMLPYDPQTGTLQ